MAKLPKAEVRISIIFGLIFELKYLNYCLWDYNCISTTLYCPISYLDMLENTFSITSPL